MRPAIKALEGWLLAAGLLIRCAGGEAQEGREADDPRKGLLAEISSPVSVFDPGAGYRFVNAIDRPMVWGSTVSVNPIPITNGTEHVHFADVGRKWLTAVRVPTLKGSPTRTSPDQERLASFGMLHRTPQDLHSKFDHFLSVVRVTDAKVMWSRKMDEDITDIAWMSPLEILYSFNPNVRRLNLKKQYVIMKLNPFTGEEKEVYRAPQEQAIFNFTPSPDGRYIEVREQVDKHWNQGLFIVELSSGKKLEIQLSKDMGWHPFNFFWWLDGKHLYFETPGDAGKGPMRVNVEDPASAEPLSRRYPLLDRKCQCSLSPSGKKLLVGHRGRGAVYLLDLETGREEHILKNRQGQWGCGVASVAWSRDERVVAGWVQTVLGVKGVGAELKYYPFVIDLERREITFYRSCGHDPPLFLIEDKEVVEALKARSVPWR